MTIKEIQAKTGAVTDYVGYIFLVFCWYFFSNWFTRTKADLSISSWITIVDWGLQLLLIPLLWAGVFGGIYSKQRSQGSEEIMSGFIQAVKAHFLRFVGTNLLSFVAYLITIVSV